MPDPNERDRTPGICPVCGRRQPGVVVIDEHGEIEELMSEAYSVAAAITGTTEAAAPKNKIPAERTTWGLGPDYLKKEPVDRPDKFKAFRSGMPEDIPKRR